jgi:hypothetical protein
MTIYGNYNVAVNVIDITIKDPPGIVGGPVTQLRLDDNDAQRLLQVLWDLGIRPAGREAEIQAVKLHLQDMRRLVFNGTGDNDR